MRIYTGLLLFLIGTLLPMSLSGQSLPDDFFDQLVDDEWPFLMGYTFDESGYGYGWTKAGRVYRSEDGARTETPWLDLSEEVGDFGDHGLLSFALHPNFSANGYIYVLYVVDRHHLLHFGTPTYDPTANDFQAPTIGRLTRYQADPATDFATFVPNSRKVLLGTGAGDGFPILHLSHGVGELVFGEDGSLLVSCGDGGSYIGTDAGGEESGAKATQAIEEGIIQSYEDVGAFRSQLVGSLNGKILRIDPDTGEGIPSNPFFDASDPRGAASRVWALGFRNPYRFSLVPETGGHDLAEGNPGELVVGDVGWAHWEEFDRVERGGQNFGWPLYEGIGLRWQYYYLPVANQTAANPLAGNSGCDNPYFLFQDLLQDASTDPNPLFLNPCAQGTEIPLSIPTFVHTPPLITYTNADWNLDEQGTFVPGYDAEGLLTRINVTDLDAPVISDFFNGVCALGGMFYEGEGYPEAFRGRYFAADLRGWIRQFDFDPNTGELSRVRPFFQGTKRIFEPVLNPADGCIWYISYDGPVTELRKICFGGNPPPTARITADTLYGVSPLRVTLSAAASTDPQDQPLSFLWEYGDGLQEEGESVVHTFTAPSDAPASFMVTLRATDIEGATHSTQQVISLNNTPPEARIASISEATQYSLTGIREVPLIAEVHDAEHGEDALYYEWLVSLHHNTHEHPEAIQTAAEGSFLIFPEGCGEEDFWYRVNLRVTDAAGLSAVDERLIFPYCGEAYHAFLDLEANYDVEGTTLGWEMEREPAQTRYLVQRSGDQTHFETVGEVAGEGLGTYTFLDSSPNFDTAYYRIEAVSAQPVVEFSPVVEMAFRGKSPIWVYPNPTQGRLNLAFQNPAESASYQILDLQGRLLMQGNWQEIEAESVQEISLRALQNGLYLYRIKSGAEVQTGKVLKVD